VSKLAKLPLSLFGESWGRGIVINTAFVGSKPTDRTKFIMIKTLLPNINPNQYIYKTNLKFGEEFSFDLLKKVKHDKDSTLVFRKNYDDPRNNPLDTYAEIGKNGARELIRRGRQIQHYYPNQSPINFTQYFLKESDSIAFLDTVPDFLKNIAPGEPLPIFQISHSGDLLPPHKGHKRKSSLFMLLEGNSEETRWYRETESFEIISTTRIPDIDKIEPVVSAVIEPGYWYVFNHLEWHSVHKFSNSIRMNIGLDFDSISAPDLIKAIYDAGYR